MIKSSKKILICGNGKIRLKQPFSGKFVCICYQYTKNTGTLKLFFRTFFGGAFLAEAMQQITAALEQKAMLF